MIDTPTTGPPGAPTSFGFERQLRDMNEALLVSSVRQHELATHAQQAADAVRQSEERYRTLFDLVPVAVYSCNTSGVIQNFNRRAAKLWGREPAFGDTDERFCGSFKLFRADGSFMPHDQCPMAEVLSGRLSEVRDAEVTIERPDGSRVTVLVNIRPLMDQSGDVTGAINCFSDITQRSELEHKTKEQAKALADLSRRKDEFLAMLSHELRNPLAPIRNAVQLLRLQRDGTEIQKEAHGMIERQVAQLARLVDDLLEVSRISTGRIHLQEARIDLRGVVASAVETSRPQSGQKVQSIATALPKGPIWINGDAMRLEQVVVNLLNNASKYTDRGGHIWVGLEQQGEEAVVRVRDNGIGIAPELLPLIFDLFTQADKSLDRSQGGLGIAWPWCSRSLPCTEGRSRCSARSAKGASSSSGCRSSYPRRQRPGFRRSKWNCPRAACGFWWSMTMWMPPREWQCCCGPSVTTHAWRTMGKAPLKWPWCTCPKSFCSTLACRS
jgi:nitrogen fixation/metabolism regulation signal transduction histidine kinase